MSDLSNLSDDQLKALYHGDFSNLSDDDLKALHSATTPDPVSVNNVVRSAATGVPIIGGLADKADAATNAFLAPALNSLFDEKDQLRKQPLESVMHTRCATRKAATPSLPANIPSSTPAQRSQAELRRWLPSLLLHLAYLELG